ncbi:hypothetical protein ZHAS_00004417 [Anopheles sinensis]|uniref:Uncharacterized protein n=1 Tax=Anopheles sinensis TaxID=74873 RepID=A0A084VGW2_ANOSI|nr:hypothetical protein ZHAS_00004417 [Anopheles sinensis]
MMDAIDSLFGRAPNQKGERATRRVVATRKNLSAVCVCVRARQHPLGETTEEENGRGTLLLEGLIEKRTQEATHSADTVATSQIAVPRRLRGGSLIIKAKQEKAQRKTEEGRGEETEKVGREDGEIK